MPHHQFRDAIKLDQGGGLALRQRPLARLLGLTLALVGLCCMPSGEASLGGQAAPGPDYAGPRARMVDRQIKARGVRDPRVLAALGKVPRHRFVPLARRDQAYQDHPLPIGHGQTISQPFIVAYMTAALGPLDSRSKVLEIGTGSGYQCAVLAELAGQVYSIEIVKPLAERAARLLKTLGYQNLHLRTGDGYAGWPDAAPFDAILLTAAPPKIPEPLLQQLRQPGGVLVAPVGRVGDDQELVRIRRTRKGFQRERLLGVRFVPMTGRAEQK